jgi:hypothetical protein
MIANQLDTAVGVWGYCVRLCEIPSKDRAKLCESSVRYWKLRESQHKMLTI